MTWVDSYEPLRSITVAINCRHRHIAPGRNDFLYAMRYYSVNVTLYDTLFVL